MLENTTELSYNTTSNDKLFFVEVVALYENGKTSVGVAKKYAYGDNVIENEKNSCNIYPNPANDRLFIETESEIYDVVIYDIYGRHQVTETPSHQDKASVDLSRLNAGIYIVKINTEKGNIVKQIIKN